MTREELTNKLRAQIDSIKDCDQVMNEASWGYESGVLITGDEAQDIITMLSLPPAEGAEQLIRVRNILQDFYRRGDYELEQAAEDIMRIFPQQPTAEGAEDKEIEQPIGQFILDNLPFEKRFQTANGMYVHYSDVCVLMNKHTALHAQKIADKMVSERCAKCKYRGLPDSINEALNSGDGVYRP